MRLVRAYQCVENQSVMRSGETVSHTFAEECRLRAGAALERVEHYRIMTNLLALGDRVLMDARFTRERALEAYLDLVGHGTSPR